MIDPIKAFQEKNWEDLKKYFEENNHLTIYELALQVNRSVPTIRIWRRKAGISKQFPFKERARIMPVTVQEVADSSIWDNEEWFKEQYENKKYGIRLISKMIKRSAKLVIGRLKKYNISARTQLDASKSKNPCSDPEWLIYHYGTKEEYNKYAIARGEEPDPDGGKCWSTNKCAENAGVVTYTIFNWLVRAKRDGLEINIRDINESISGERNPFYGKKHSPEALKKLKEFAKNGTAIARAKAIAKKAESAPTS